MNVKYIFCGNTYWLQSILILRKSYVFHCGFLYLILTRPKLTVWLCEGVEVTQWANVLMLMTDLHCSPTPTDKSNCFLSLKVHVVHLVVECPDSFYMMYHATICLTAFLERIFLEED
jgi:hypothetical protein